MAALGDLVIRLSGDNRWLKRTVGQSRTMLSRFASFAGRLATNGTATDRMADLQDRIRAAEQRATEVREQIIVLSRELVDAREVAQACSLFDPVWETLTAREQARILHLLIQRVDYDGDNGSVSVTFHPTGIKTLAEELKEQEAIA